MKREFKVKVFQKGAEFRWNGGAKNKVEFFPPIVDVWLPESKQESVTFKTGRKKWELTVKRVK